MSHDALAISTDDLTLTSLQEILLMSSHEVLRSCAWKSCRSPEQVQAGLAVAVGRRPHPRLDIDLCESQVHERHFDPNTLKSCNTCNLP